MSGNTETPVHNGTKPEWHYTLLHYQQPDRKKALWQIITTFTLYAILWCLMVLNLSGYKNVIIHLGLCLIAAGVHVRIFIFSHDCCHQSFFASHRVNTILGHICGVLTLTPYEC